MTKFIDTYHSLGKNQKRLIYFLVFTCFFLITAFLCYGYFFTQNKSFFWIGGGKDGLSQNYNCLVYFSQYLKTFFYNLFVEHSVQLPQWEFGLGYGADIITTTGFVTVGDIFNWFSVFVSKEHIHTFYHVMGFVRLYLAGICFSLYCWKMGRRQSVTLIGAFVYMFCGYALINLPREVFFINPMIFLPLLFLGSEKILRGERPYVFIGAIFLSVIGSVQFFYILCLITLFYVVLRYFCMSSEKTIRTVLSIFFQFVFYGLIGMMIGAFVFVPTTLRFLGDSRGSVGQFEWLYPLTYYRLLLPSLVSYQIPGGGTTHLVMTPMVIVTTIVFFFQKSKETLYLKILLIVSTVMLMTPLGGYFMNGFSETSNRWIFIYAFIIALVFVYALPTLFALTKKQLIILNGLVISYCFICFLVLKPQMTYTEIPLMILIAITLFVTLLNILKSFSYRKVIYIGGLYGLVLLGVITNAYYINSRNHGRHPSEFLDYNKAYSVLTSTGIENIQTLKDQSFYRYEDRNSGVKSFFNSGLNDQVGGPNYFFSFSNPYVQRYYNVFEVGSENPLYFESLDFRMILQSLSSIKYMSVSDYYQKSVPSSYKYVKTTSQNGEDLHIYKNNYAMPFGYTYEKSISEEQFLKYNVVDKQRLMTEYVVLKESQDKDLSYEKTKPLDYTLTYDKSIQKVGNTLRVKKKNATITLSLKDIIQCDELYVSLQNLSYKPQYELSVSSQVQSRLDERLWRAPTSTYVSAEGQIKQSLQVRTSEHLYHSPYKKNYTMNVKDVNNGKITLTFQKVGEYSLDDIQVYPLRYKEQEKQLLARQQDHLENVSFQANEVKGHITVDREKYLVLSLPYTDGWKAYVDGKEVDIECVNIMYAGIKLSQGSHEIVMRYETPGLKEGIILSLVGLGTVVTIAVYHKKTKKKR